VINLPPFVLKLGFKCPGRAVDYDLK